MGNVLLDMAVSLDGIVAVPEPDNYRLHAWYFSNQAPTTAAIIDELITQTGAIIMGKRAYDLGDKLDGFVDNAYKVPHFVITHHPPVIPAKGTTEFIFVTDGIKSALAQAQNAAGDKAVIIGGGVQVAQQFLQAGLVDELQLHVVHVIVGKGLRLFDMEIEQTELDCLRNVEGNGVTHIRFRVKK